MPVEQLQIWILQYGYVAIFGLLMFGIIGLPIPDETLLTLVGYLIFRGTLHPLPALCVAVAGAASGITLSYGIGRLGGRAVLRRYGPRFHLTPDRVLRAENWFHRYGRWTLVFGYFVPGVRHIIAIIAGSSDLGLGFFAAYAYAGATVWSAVFLSAGYLLGKEWDRFPGIAHTVALAVVGLLLAGGLVIVIVRHLRARSR